MAEDWHAEDIKAAIRKKGMTLSELARLNGAKPQSLSASVAGRHSEPADLIIARFLGLHPSKIWPSRYNADGTRMRLRRLPEKERAAA